MHVVAMIAGIVCVFTVLLDAFQTIILPRRATGRVRLTRIFYIITWPPWVFFANRMHHPRKRETAFSFYGPLSLIFLLALWAALLLFGFGLLYYSLGRPFYDIRQTTGLWSDLYVSGTEIFTSSPSDAGPLTGAARWLMVIEAGTGFGFLAIIMGYFPVLYAAFSRREVSISLLDARAGSPPTASELLRRHADADAAQALSVLLIEWERWSAELLESHISFPLLCYFRSQHTNQSWISALTCILDTSSLLIAGVQGDQARQAQLTFAMARHAMVDLTQVLTSKPIANTPDRLPSERYSQLNTSLCQAGAKMCFDICSEQRLRELRRLYEPYAETLSRYFCMPLPPWIPDQPRKDNWLAVARLRANVEEANPPAGLVPGGGHAHTVCALQDDHQDF